jgi:hypothetical protein
MNMVPILGCSQDRHSSILLAAAHSRIKLDWNRIFSRMTEKKMAPGNMKRRIFQNKTGVLLVAVILLVVFASIAVLGVSTFVIQQMRQVEAKEIQDQSIHLAHAGLHQAFYHFRNNKLSGNGYFSLGPLSVEEAGDCVIGGSAADLLMVDTSTAVFGNEKTPEECAAEAEACRDQCDADAQICSDQCGGAWWCLFSCEVTRVGCRLNCDAQEQECNRSGTELINLKIQNATNSKSLTIDRMVVTWNRRSRRLTEIKINGLKVWSGNASSPANVNLSPDVLLDTVPSLYGINYVKFSRSMVGTPVNLQFLMADGTSKSLSAYPASNNFNFTVQSMGKQPGENIFRTITANYNAVTQKVIRYDESEGQVVP